MQEALRRLQEAQVGQRGRGGALGYCGWAVDAVGEVEAGARTLCSGTAGGTVCENKRELMCLSV